MRETMLVHFLDEVAQHLLGDVEVRDHAVLQRPDRADRSGRAPEHALRLEPDCVHIAGRLVDRDDRRLAQHDPAPAHVHERVGRAEVDGHVASAEPGQIIEDAHRQDQPTVPALALALALGSAVLHAAWNLLLARARDGRAGIQRAGALTYFVLALAGPNIVYPALVGPRAMRRELGFGVAAAALANIGSFALGLLALRRGAAAPVLAVRSTSIVFATLLAGRMLTEHVSRARLAGSLIVFGGVAL